MNKSNNYQSLDVIIAAGGTPCEGEPLFENCAGKPKALLDFAGKPMIQWVLDALSASQHIRRVIIIGLPPFTDLHCDHPLTIQETHGSILANLQAGVLALQNMGEISSKVLLVSSDIPAISGEMIDWVIDTVHRSDHDLYYSVIPREIMEKKFPSSKRTYLKLADVEVCGGDVNAIDPQFVFKKQDLFDQIIGSRKNPLKQASILGFDTLFLILLKKMTLHKAEENISKKIGARGHAIVCPYAEVGMDVDKSYQLTELLSVFQSTGREN